MAIEKVGIPQVAGSLSLSGTCKALSFLLLLVQSEINLLTLSDIARCDLGVDITDNNTKKTDI